MIPNGIGTERRGSREAQALKTIADEDRAAGQPSGRGPGRLGVVIRSGVDDRSSSRCGLDVRPDGNRRQRRAPDRETRRPRAEASE